MKMKIATIIVVLALIVSCKGKTDNSFEHETSTTDIVKQGKLLFNGKGVCNTCHLTNKKLIGPSLEEMAKTYTEKKGNIVAFLREEAKPIMDSTQFLLMKPNFVLTKEMTEDELRSLEAYIYSYFK